MKNKQKKKVSNIMLVVVCVMIILYAAANFALQYFTSIEVSPTLTTAWFTFWGSEIVALTSIKISKVLKGTEAMDYDQTAPEEFEYKEEYTDEC